MKIKAKKIIALVLTAAILVTALSFVASAIDPEDCSHDYSVKVVTVEPTCTTQGIVHYLCSKCGDDEGIDYYTETIHELIKDGDADSSQYYTTTTPATCTDWGWRDYYCDICDTWICDEDIEPLGHDSYWKIDFEPTADHDGQMTKHCKRCNAVLETETFSAHEHSYGYEITLIQATCTSDGEKGIVCEHCNAVYNTETVPASGHYNDALNDYWNDADSTLIDYSGCGDVLTTMPTSTENGKIVFICEKCGQVMRSYDLESTGHYSATLNDYLTDAYSVPVDYCGWTNVETTMPTCTKNGRVVFNCDTCGQTIRSYNVEATGHDDGVWKIDFEATPDHDGQMTRYCSICDAALETKSFSLHEHSYGYEKIIREATCTTDGEKGIFCSKCGTVYDVEPIYATGHAEGYTKLIEKPMCTQKGCKGTFCATCGILYATEAIDAEGHEGGTWRVDYEPTADHDGHMSRYCIKCGQVLETKTFEKHEHTYGYEKVIKAPTCTEEGSKEIYCAKCGCVYDIQPVAAKGHVDSDNNGRCDVCFRRMSGGEHCVLCGAVHSCYGIGKLVYAYHYILHIVIKIIRTAAPFLNVLFY